MLPCVVSALLVWQVSELCLPTSWLSVWSPWRTPGGQGRTAAGRARPLHAAEWDAPPDASNGPNCQRPACQAGQRLGHLRGSCSYGGLYTSESHMDWWNDAAALLDSGRTTKAAHATWTSCFRNSRAKWEWFPAEVSWLIIPLRKERKMVTFTQQNMKSLSYEKQLEYGLALSYCQVQHQSSSLVPCESPPILAAPHKIYLCGKKCQKLDFFKHLHCFIQHL